MMYLFHVGAIVRIFVYRRIRTLERIGTYRDIYARSSNPPPPRGCIIVPIACSIMCKCVGLPIYWNLRIKPPGSFTIWADRAECPLGSRGRPIAIFAYS